MNFLGIGMLELALIVLFALMLVGPVDMVRLARKAGVFVRQIKNSEFWSSIQGSRRAVDRVGRELMGGTEAELDGIRRELSKIDFGSGDLTLVKDFNELKSGLVEQPINRQKSQLAKASLDAPAVVQPETSEKRA